LTLDGTSCGLEEKRVGGNKAGLCKIAQKGKTRRTGRRTSEAKLYWRMINGVNPWFPAKTGRKGKKARNPSCEDCFANLWK